MVNYPVVSVVLPVFNGEKYIAEAVESILCQSFDSFELIIIDDGSVDNTFNVLEKYRDVRIKLIKNNANEGLARSLNKGIRLSQGKYLARMDADDVCRPNRLSRQVEFLEGNCDVAVCGCWMESFDGKNTFTFPVGSDEILFQLLYGPPVAHPSVMMRRSILIDHQLFYDEDFIAAQDYEFWARLFRVGRFANIPEILLRYRVHVEQISHLKANVQKAAANSVRRRLLNELGLNVSDLDLERHVDFFCGKFNVNVVDFNWIENWIGRLLEVNLIYKRFDHEKLKNLLAIKLWKYCQSSSVAGLLAWNSLINSMVYIYANIDRFKIFKFYLKCFYHEISNKFKR